MTWRTTRKFAAWLASAAFVGATAAQSLDRSEPPEGARITERLDEPVPLDVRFTDDTGRAVTLGAYFERGVPVVLTPVYYRCPNICNATLTGLAEAANEIDWSAGRDFEIVTFSFNPNESYQLAEVKKRNYLTVYDRETAAAGWHFLVGDEPNIAALTEALGFGYRAVERTGDYAHPPSIIVCTADGRISRYINTVMPEASTLRKALVEASAGSIGSAWDRIVLWCYSYDPSSNKYVVAARKVMFAGGIVTVLLTFGTLALLWRREMKSRRNLALGGLES
jgi:protein SCO1/2